jgi:ribulose-phosphate 3-epimerase
MSKVIVSPSILAADFSNLDSELKRIKDAGIEYLHFDVMDGQFVNNVTFGVPLLKQLSPKFDFTYDVHLMIVNPKEVYKEFVSAGADVLTFHYEAMNSDEEVEELINLIKKENCKVGISIKPSTDISRIEKFLPLLDVVLVMSVEPGFGGQKFLDSALDKISYLSNFKKLHNLAYFISVDGGINAETGPRAIKAGADILVSGTYLFKSLSLKDDILRLVKEK